MAWWLMGGRIPLFSCLNSNVGYLVSDVWCLVSDVWCLKYGVVVDGGQGTLDSISGFGKKNDD